MMLLCVEKLVDQEYSREISGSTDMVNALILLLHKMAVQLPLPR